MKRLLAVGILVVVLLGTVPISGAQSADRDPIRTLDTPQDFDRVQFVIKVFENGSARWTFHYERTLENESEREQFEAFAREFNRENSSLYRNFKRQARTLTAAGQNATGRNMTASNFTKEATIGGLNGNVGTVEMSFTWSNFTQREGKRHVLGDVFEGGLYLAPNQSLVIETGKGLEFRSTKPKPDVKSESTLEDSDSITWMDEHEFADNRPYIEFAPNSSQSLGEIAGGDDGDSPGILLFAGAVVMLIGLGAVVAWRRGGFGLPSLGGDGSPGGTGAAEAAGTGSGGSGSSVQPAVSDEELLTDEARVKKLLRENGGRMKQVNIVEDTGWSKSKVSMLLSDMAEDGEISKLRVGRENIISLDGHEPDAARSPHDEPR